MISTYVGRAETPTIATHLMLGPVGQPASIATRTRTKISIRSTQSMPDEFLTVDDVAQLLKLNPQAVRNMIDRGELAAVRVGARRVRIQRSDLDAYLAEGRRLTHMRKELSSCQLSVRRERALVAKRALQRGSQ